MNFKIILSFMLFSASIFSQQITLLTYNILSDTCVNANLYPDNANVDWSVRFPKLCKKINQTYPEIICLQEVSEACFEEFQNHFLEYTGCFTKKKSSSGIGIATFCKKNLFKDVSFKKVLCPGTSNCGNFAIQPMIIAKILTDQERILTLVNTKIKWKKNSDETLATKNHITSIIESLPQENALVVGDFNLTPDSKHIQKLCSIGLVDIFKDLNAPTCLANGTYQRIDYIFATPNLSITAIPCSKISNQPILPSIEEPSDHIPLICQIEI